MSERTYHPDRGDLIEINFQPGAGREIDKRRPAIVLTTLAYNRKSGFCVAVPLTSNLTPGPFWIQMPDGFVPRPSLILCDYVKSLDYRERGARKLGRVPTELLDRVVLSVFDLLDPAP